MSVTITAAQRDALYDQILDRLSGIGDIEVAIQAENSTTPSASAANTPMTCGCFLTTLESAKVTVSRSSCRHPRRCCEEFCPGCDGWP